MKIHFSSSRGKTKIISHQEFLEIETLVKDCFRHLISMMSRQRDKETEGQGDKGKKTERESLVV